jgi:hypothetical protein
MLITLTDDNKISLSVYNSFWIRTRRLKGRNTSGHPQYVVLHAAKKNQDFNVTVVL